MSAFHGRTGAVYIGQPYCLELSNDASTTVADDSVFDFHNTNYSIEVWFSSSSNPAAKTNIISKRNGAADTICSDAGWEAIIRPDGKFHVVCDNQSGNSDTVSSTSSDICDGTLKHLVYTQDASTAFGTVKIFVNGEFDNSDTQYTPDINDSDIIIGGSGGECFLHQLRIYNDDLSNAEISDLYKGRKAARNKCVADWRFGNGRGTSVYDQSGNSHTATLGSTDLWNSANATSDMLIIGLGFHEWSLDITADEHDCTEFGGATGNAPYPRQFTPGLTSWTATADRYLQSPDFAYRVNNNVFVRLYWNEDNDERYEGWGIITGVSPTAPVDDLVTETITIRGKSTLSIATT